MASDERVKEPEAVQPKSPVSTVAIVVLAFVAFGSFVVFLAVGDFWSIFVLTISLFVLSSFPEKQLLWWNEEADDDGDEPEFAGASNG